MEKRPRLFIVIPCYNEQEVLPITAPMFLEELHALTAAGKIAEDSRVLFVNDGSRDDTWKIIRELSAADPCFQGLCLSRNRGHQNALLCGLMEARGHCDITISIDCDGQDDIRAMDQMVDEYLDGAEIVYGVRSSRETDTFFKRFTAQSFYKLLNAMGADTVYNHADYRLVSARVLKEFANFREVNIFLRGMFPLVGFKSTSVAYERHERLAGKSHYPLKKMLALAFDGITSLSVKPIRIITGLGVVISCDLLPADPLRADRLDRGQRGGRLGQHPDRRGAAGRHPADLPGRDRGIRRKDLPGNQAPPALYRQRADGGDGAAETPALRDGRTENSSGIPA